MALALPTGQALAVPAEIRFSAASVEYGDLRLEKVQAELSPAGTYELLFDRMSGPGEAYLGGGLKVSGKLETLLMDPTGFEFSGNLTARGLHADVTLRSRGDELMLKLDADAEPITVFAEWPGLPAEVAWLKRGLFDLGLRFEQAAERPASLQLSVDVDDLSLDSPDGRYAAEALEVGIQGLWSDVDLAAATVRGAIRGGELLIDDFYRDFSGSQFDFAAEANWDERSLDIERLSFGDDGALAGEARIELGFGRESADWSMEVSRLELDFPSAYHRYLEPIAAAWTLNGLTLTGRMVWSGEWVSGELAAGELGIYDFSAVDTQRERFALTGLQARVRPGDHDFDSRLAWRGLLLGRINLGAGEAQLDSEPGTVALLEPLVLDVLGGQIELQTLKFILPGSRADGGSEPDIRLQARLRELDIDQLTAALGWPSFGGRISGEIPGVSLDDGVLGVDGQIRFDVFGGRIEVNDLSMERPFGVLPSLAADIAVEDLDLEQLTRTFSFGQIAGRLDGQVKELRMLDWKPVAFDAWLGTPKEQSGANDISRQAVNRLTTLGGGSATTALASPLMRMFSSFSYRRLGLGCRLQNNVCHLRGLSEDDSSVLILEGAGIPKITIRAYNRSIDWPQMVSNLLAISTESTVQIGRQPDS